MVALFLVRRRHGYRAQTEYGRPADTRRHGRLFHYSPSSGAGVRDRHGVVAVPGGGEHGHARGSTRTSNGSGNLRSEFSVSVTHLYHRLLSGEEFRSVGPCPFVIAVRAAPSTLPLSSCAAPGTLRWLGGGGRDGEQVNPSDPLPPQEAARIQPPRLDILLRVRNHPSRDNPGALRLLIVHGGSALSTVNSALNERRDRFPLPWLDFVMDHLHPTDTHSWHRHHG